MDGRPDVVVVGDIMVDVAVASGALKRGGDVHGTVRLRPGGAGANAAVWAAAAGARTRLHGKVGEDLAGAVVLRALEDRGVDAAVPTDRTAPTGTMLVVVEDGERSMVADRGANATLSAHDLPQELLGGAVLVSGYLLFHPDSEPAARAALDRAHAHHVAVDAASWPLVAEYGPQRFLEATSAATLLLANRREAAAVAGRDPENPGDLEDLVRLLAQHYRAVAVKAGGTGAAGIWDGRLVSCPARAVTEVDPTGAGDAFDGALLAALAAGASPEEALERACAAGARAAGSASNWPER